MLFEMLWKSFTLSFRTNLAWTFRTLRFLTKIINFMSFSQNLSVYFKITVLRHFTPPPKISILALRRLQTAWKSFTFGATDISRRVQEHYCNLKDDFFNRWANLRCLAKNCSWCFKGNEIIMWFICHSSQSSVLNDDTTFTLDSE